MKAVSFCAALTCGAIGFAAPAAQANDSALAYGGSPRPLSAHPTVSMTRERVKMEVGEKEVVVDCTFDFENHGPTCKVRMGFPDQGEGAADPDEEGMHNPPVGTFRSFNSWVDGKPVTTTLIRATQEGEYWHVKTVTFPANRTVRVRDLYRVDVGASIAYNIGHCETSYILHTGSSWHGTIGRSEIDVVFKGTSVHAPINVKRIVALPRRSGPSHTTPSYAKETSGDKRIVYYLGPCRPEVSGKTLRFVRNRWRATTRDDILLVFDLSRPLAQNR